MNGVIRRAMARRPPPAATWEGRLPAFHHGGCAMTLDNAAALDSAHGLTAFAADLTDAAYRVALRHGIDGSWIDLQLDVWRALAASVDEMQRASPRSPSAAEYLVWREEFL